MPAEISDSSGSGPRGPRPRPVIKLVEIALAFAIMGALWSGITWVIISWRNARCPATTFLSGSPPADCLFVYLPTAFAVVGLGFLLSNLITGISPATRKTFDGDAQRRRSRQSLRSQAALARLSAMLFVVGASVSVAASFVQFCITPDEIRVRSAIWKPMRSYPLSAVSEVKTSCHLASKGWDIGYRLTLSDGTAVDVMGGDAPLREHRTQFEKALDPVPFRFDFTGVDSPCRTPLRDMLVTRP